MSGSIILRKSLFYVDLVYDNPMNFFLPTLISRPHLCGIIPYILDSAYRELLSEGGPKQNGFESGLMEKFDKILFNATLNPSLEFVTHFVIVFRFLTNPSPAMASLLESFPRLEALRYSLNCAKYKNSFEAVKTDVSTIVSTCPRLRYLDLGSSLYTLKSSEQVVSFFDLVPPTLGGLGIPYICIEGALSDDEDYYRILNRTKSLRKMKFSGVNTSSFDPLRLVHPTHSKLEEFHLYVEPSQSVIAPDVVARILAERCCRTLTRFAYVNFETPGGVSPSSSSSSATTGFSDLFCNCPFLESFELQMPQGYPTDSLLTDKDLEDAFGDEEMIKNNNNGAEEKRTSSIKQQQRSSLLKSFTVSNVPSLTRRGLKHLFKCSPFLESLQVKSIGTADQDMVDDECLIILSERCGKNLKRLVLSSSGFKSILTGKGFYALGKNCPNIHDLHLTPNDNTGLHEGLVEIFKNGNMKSLALYEVTKITDETCVALGRYCSGLQTLSLTFNELITSVGLCAIAEGCLCLIWADVSGFELADEKRDLKPGLKALIEGRLKWNLD